MKRLIIISILIFINVCYADETERLLPTSEEKNMVINGRRDGGSVYFTITNNSNEYILTNAKFYCVIQRENGNIGIDFFNLWRNNRYDFSKSNAFFSGKLLPGKKAEVYLESPDSTSKLLNCYLTDMRGRAKKMMEFW